MLAQRRADEQRRRGEAGHDGWQSRCEALAAQLLAHPLWSRARGIAAFAGFGGEPDTQGVLAATLAAGKRLWLPRVTSRAAAMRFHPVDDLERLERHRFGMLQPLARGVGVASPGPEHGVDLVLMPGLAFDRDGARLGFGAGHYDRSFGPRRERPELAMPILCGVCFARYLQPRPGIIPMLAHDLAMDFVLTEQGLERCRVIAGADWEPSPSPGSSA